MMRHKINSTIITIKKTGPLAVLWKSARINYFYSPIRAKAFCCLIPKPNNFEKRARAAGINVPIAAGIMPVTNKKQIERMVTLCGASLPSKFVKMMQKYENDPEALRSAGIAYAIDQIVDLISNDVQGIHLYAMNNPAVASRIYNGIKDLL